MINKKFLVSVLVINYNKQVFISRCLDSLVNQNFRNFEVIFSDDMSKDNSIDVAKNYKKKLNLKIVKGFNRSNYGCYNQMNAILRAFKKSSGKIIMFLDSDDFFHSTKISSIVKFFKDSSNKKKIIFDIPYIYYSRDKIKNFIVKKKISNKIWPHSPPQSCISMERDSFKKVFFQISFKKFFNIWFDFRVAFYSYFISKNFEILDKKLTYYFIDPNGVSSNFNYLTFNWWIRRSEAFDFYRYLFRKFFLKFPLTIDYCMTKIISTTLILLKKS